MGNFYHVLSSLICTCFVFFYTYVISLSEALLQTEQGFEDAFENTENFFTRNRSTGIDLASNSPVATPPHVNPPSKTKDSTCFLPALSFAGSLCLPALPSPWVVLTCYFPATRLRVLCC